jgi:hypothetical protein
MNIPTTNRAEKAVIARLKEVVPHQTRRQMKFVPGHGHISGLIVITPGWEYFIGKFSDGWGVYPENSSINYAKLVDHLIALLVEAHLHETIKQR